MILFNGKDNIDFWLNPDHIQAVWRDGHGAVIQMTGGDRFYVKESVETVTKIINRKFD